MSGPPITPRSVAQATGMTRIAPPPDLSDLVEQHWVVRWDRRELPPLRREILPDPSVNLSVEPRGCLLHGPGTGHSLHELTGVGMVIGTKFRPGGFSGFCPGPVSALRGRALTLADAFGPAGGRLESTLATRVDTDTVLETITSFLRAHRPAPDPHRALAMELVAAMRAAAPGTQVGDLAARFGISTRTLQRLFAEHVGVSPKQVLQRFRRQLATDLLREEPEPNLGRLAAELGYFDQAHLARDLRKTLGRGPSGLRASG